jgi:large subunit ribosomal protein L7/L12
MTGKVDKLVEQLDSLDKSALKELGKALERIFGVSSYYAPAKPKVVQQVVEEKIEEQKEFNVVMNNFGRDKLGVIKTLRVIKQLGLKEAKDLAETTDAVILEGVDKDIADQTANRLREVGATVSIV